MGVAKEEVPIFAPSCTARKSRILAKTCLNSLCKPHTLFTPFNDFLPRSLKTAAQDELVNKFNILILAHVHRQVYNNLT